MIIKRKFYAFSDLEKATTDDDADEIIADMNMLFANSNADWFEEETRYQVGDLLIVCFKLTWFEESDK